MIFFWRHAIGGMQVERGLQTRRVQIFQQLRRVGQQFLIPRPTRPPVAVPIHIENHVIEREIVLPGILGRACPIIRLMRYGQ